mgnify:CR=1 FL=1
MSERYLGLDVGERYIGVAISDELGLVASPLMVIDARRNDPFAALAQLVDQYQAVGLVVGLPRQLRGGEGTQAKTVRAFISQLREHIACPIVLWDEWLTTAQAERALIASGQRRERRRQVIDAVAAALLLQNYLDARRAQGDGVKSRHLDQ